MVSSDIVATAYLWRYSALVAAGALSFEDAVALLANEVKLWKRQLLLEVENGCCYEYRSKSDSVDLAYRYLKRVENISPANYTRPRTNSDCGRLQPWTMLWNSLQKQEANA